MSTGYDSDELQALFDDISTRTTASSPAPTGSLPSSVDDEPDIYKRIGLLVRRLHDALQETGQQNVLFQAKSVLPESRERLTFIGDLMEKSATQCVLLTEQEIPRLEASSNALMVAKAGWDTVVLGESTVAQFQALALHMPVLMQSAIDDQKKVKTSLIQILMAQGFQDLAGQTLTKVILQVRAFERELLVLLAFAAEGSPQKEQIADFLDGPQFKLTQNAVHSQSEVDDLLKDLGF